MQPVDIDGVLKKQDRLFTENLESCKGVAVSDEKLMTIDGREFRSWNPYRSKLAAAIVKGLQQVTIRSDFNVLYLGAATGTTVSHVSDIVKNGMVYAVECSPIAMKKLLQVSILRQNIVPLLADANHPERYSSFVPSVDLLYQDISQRNQAEIFIKNSMRFLKKGGYGIFMVKARSVDVSLKPTRVYELVADEMRNQGLKVLDIRDLAPFEKDHAALSISF
jgi:fibrillarin-like pre-rRNA processing protein